MAEDAKPNEGNQELEHLQEQVRKWQAKATHLEKTFANIDPEKYKALEEEVNNYKRDAAKGNPEELENVIKSQYEKRYGEKFGNLEKENTDLKTRINKLEVVNPAMLKAANVFNSSELPLMQMVIEKDLTLADGQIVVRDGDKFKYSKKDPRSLMSLDEYMEDLADRYPGCAKPRGKNGARDGGEYKPTNGDGSKDYSNLTRDEFMKLSDAEAIKVPAQVVKKFIDGF